MGCARNIHRLLPLRRPSRSGKSISFLTDTTEVDHSTLQSSRYVPFLSRLVGSFRKQPTCHIFRPPSLSHRLLNTTSSIEKRSGNNRKEDEDDPLHFVADDTTQEEETSGWDGEGEETDGWEEEEETEPKIGDGGDGGGIVLQGVPWGERALSIAQEVILQFGDDIKLYSFKTTPREYIYVRLDKLSNKYGCPGMEELESYSRQYKKRLEEVGALGEIPDDLALEVSSPGAERILKVPDDLCRFKDMPMRVCYLDAIESNGSENIGVFLLESIETESANCVWKLANVKENRDPESKGRPLSRKRRDWRLKLPFEMHRMVTLYLE